ncbi:Ras guanine nucleotide exchange factor [Pelomyxa schiedti]|nr:Ras guanine nucleotide exchange factor [Pelomyxa schiedti]
MAPSVEHLIFLMFIDGEERRLLLDKNLFLAEFFLSYQQITTQHKVFDLLVKSFMERDSTVSPTAQEEQTRILHALKTWLSLVPEDFTENCPNALVELLKWRDCATTLMCTPQNRSASSHSILLQLPQEVRREICLSMRDLLEISLKFSEFFLDLKVFIHHRCAHPQWNAFSSSIASQIFRIPPKASAFNLPVQYECYSPQEPFSQPLLELMEPHECAWHITCVTGEIYRRIQVKEFAHQGWMRPTRQTDCPHITIMLNTSNAISYWVCRYVLSKSTIDQRVSALAKVIDLADNLLKINNVFSSMAVVAGVNLVSLRRLKKTLAKLPKKSQKRMEYLFNLIDPKFSSRSLRNFIRAAKPPCLPYLCLYLTDIVFIMDGDPDTIGTQVNFAKCRMFSTVIREILTLQQIPFTPPPMYQHPHHRSSSGNSNSTNRDLVQQMLLSTTHGSEEEMYKLSLLREPRAQHL